MKENFRDFLTNKFSILESCGIPPQEIVALYYDLRPLVRTGVPLGDFMATKEICSRLGFKLLTMESYGPNKNSRLCLISKSEKKLKEYYKLEKKYIEKSVGPFLLGKFLGYPACCIEEFIKNLHRKNRNQPTKTFSNTKGKLDFRLNYLYNFNSRQFNYQEFNRISESYRLSNIYLIPHIPCSFNCKESIKYAQKLLNILRIDFPGYYRKLMLIIKRPILYFNDFVFFPLTGEMENNTLSYQGFLKIHNHLPAKIVKSLEKGNLIKEENNNLQICKNGCYIDTLPSGVKLFNFE